MGEANHPYELEAYVPEINHRDGGYRCPRCEALHHSNQATEAKLQEAKRQADAMETEALTLKGKCEELVRELFPNLKANEFFT